MLFSSHLAAKPQTSICRRLWSDEESGTTHHTISNHCWVSLRVTQILCTVVKRGFNIVKYIRLLLFFTVKAKLLAKINWGFIWHWIWVKLSCKSIITTKEALLRFTVVSVLGTLILIYRHNYDLHESLTHIQSQIKPWLLVGESFTLTQETVKVIYNYKSYIGNFTLTNSHSLFMEATVKATLNNIIRAISYIYSCNSMNMFMHCFNLHKRQKALHNISITHSYTTQWSCHARHRPARRVQLAFFVFPKGASEHVQEEVGGWKQPTLGLMEPLDHLNHSLLKKSCSELYITSELQFITEHKPTTDMCFIFNDIFYMYQLHFLSWDYVILFLLIMFEPEN